jgi:hypothetical protein
MKLKGDASTRERTPQTDPAIQLVDGLVFERAALEHWKSIKGTTDHKRLVEFIAGYGKNRMGRLAHDALQRLATPAWRKVRSTKKAKVLLLASGATLVRRTHPRSPAIRSWSLRRRPRLPPRSNPAGKIPINSEGIYIRRSKHLFRLRSGYD